MRKDRPVTGTPRGQPALPVVAVQQVENHHVCGVHELALDGQEPAVRGALGRRLVPHPVQKAAVSYLAASGT